MARLGVLDGVREQVDQDLTQTLLVGVHVQRQVRRPLVMEVDALGRRLQPEHVDQLIQELDQLHLVAVEPQQAVLDARNVQQPVDEVRQMLGAAADDPYGVLGRRAGVALHELGVAGYRVQRRADLVTDAHQVARLRHVGRLGDFLGPLQGRVGALMGLDLLHQHVGLVRGFLFRGAAALMGEHDDPGRDPGEHQQAQEDHPQCRADDVAFGYAGVAAVLVVDERKQQPIGKREAEQQTDELPARVFSASAQRPGSSQRSASASCCTKRLSSLHTSWQRASSVQHSEQIGPDRPGTVPCRGFRSCSRRWCSGSRSGPAAGGSPPGLRAR